MKTKFTPGPWKAKLNSKPYAIYAVGPEGIEEESIFKTPLGHVFRSHVRGHEGQQEANAKLIAAAPDLLEACQNLLYLGERLEEESGEDHPEVEHVRQAIKKATE